jgi:hypothetical protein
MSGSWGAQLIGGMQAQAGGGNPLNVGGTATGPLVDCPGGQMVFAVAGTFNGCTVTLECLGPDGQTMLIAGAATTLTAAGMGVAYLPPCQVQAVVTGGPPSGLFASLARVVG